MLFFGSIGAITAALGGLLTFYLTLLWLIEQTQQRPLFIFALILIVAGLLLFLVGFLAELIVNQTERLDELARQLTPPEGEKPR